MAILYNEKWWTEEKKQEFIKQVYDREKKALLSGTFNECRPPLPSIEELPKIRAEELEKFEKPATPLTSMGQFCTLFGNNPAKQTCAEHRDSEEQKKAFEVMEDDNKPRFTPN